MFVFCIKNIRENRKISLKELSKKVNLSISYLSELENNKKQNPTLSNLYLISNALNVNIKDLFYTELDINILKRKLYKMINKYGVDSNEALEISQILDLLIFMKIKKG